MAYEKKQYTKKSYKPAEKKAEYKPKRGQNDGSRFTVQGEGLSYKQKRGPLSKLMSEEEKATASIHELSYDFGCRDTQFNSLNIDLTRILKILTSIVKTMRQKIGSSASCFQSAR